MKHSGSGICRCEDDSVGRTSMSDGKYNYGLSLPYRDNSGLSVRKLNSSFKTWAHHRVAWCSLVFNVLTLSYFFYTFPYFHYSVGLHHYTVYIYIYIYIYINNVPINACAQHLGSTQALSD